MGLVTELTPQVPMRSAARKRGQEGCAENGIVG
jgi:hypothetical protein